MKIYCMSLPKAGTHLLLELAREVLGEGAWYDDPDLKFPREGTGAFFDQVDERIRRHGDNFAIKGHIPWTAEIERGLLDRGFKLLFCVRDPRDVLVSTMRWLTDLRAGWDVSRYLLCVPAAERLSLVINGLPHLAPFDLDSHYLSWNQPISTRYASLLPWADSASTLLLRFEDLSGNLGPLRKAEALRAAYRHLGLDRGDADLDRISLRNPEARTFHSGDSGAWIRHFQPHHVRMFEMTSGEELVERFGYPPTRSTFDSAQSPETSPGAVPASDVVEAISGLSDAGRTLVMRCGDAAMIEALAARGVDAWGLAPASYSAPHPRITHDQSMLLQGVDTIVLSAETLSLASDEATLFADLTRFVRRYLVLHGGSPVQQAKWRETALELGYRSGASLGAAPHEHVTIVARGDVAIPVSTSHQEPACAA